jgi:hypothetical protein
MVTRKSNPIQMIVRVNLVTIVTFLEKRKKNGRGLTESFAPQGIDIYKGKNMFVPASKSRSKSRSVHL